MNEDASAKIGKPRGELCACGCGKPHNLAIGVPLHNRMTGERKVAWVATRHCQFMFVKAQDPQLVR